MRQRIQNAGETREGQDSDVGFASSENLRWVLNITRILYFIAKQYNLTSSVMKEGRTAQNVVHLVYHATSC